MKLFTVFHNGVLHDEFDDWNANDAMGNLVPEGAYIYATSGHIPPAWYRYLDLQSRRCTVDQVPPEYRAQLLLLT